MSISVASTTIKYSRKSGVYTTEIMSPSGDLVQYYKGSDENPGSIYQDFGKLKPQLYLMTISSRKGEGNSGRVYHTSVKIYVNDLLLEFDPNTKLSTTIFGTKAGQFKLISSTNDNKNYDGIEIQENLLPYAGTPESGYAAITIKMVGHVTYNSQTDDVQGTYTIPCARVVGNPYHVTIVAADKNNFVITDDTDTEGKKDRCLLKVMAYELKDDGAEELTTGLSYVWKRSDPMEESGWSTLSAKGQILTVLHSDVTAYADYKCDVYLNGVLIGSDVRNVKDATDEKGINLHPNPLDETIEEGSGGYVTYTPKVTSNGVELEGYVFRFLAMDSAGVPMNKYQDGNGDTENDYEMSTTPQQSYNVTEAMCKQAQGDVSLTVFAERKTS